MIDVFIPKVEQVATAKEFVIHPLVLNLDQPNRVCKGLRFKNSLAILRLTYVL